MDQTQLLKDLERRTRENLAVAKKLDQLSLAELNQRPAPNGWSILECLEHLNRYAAFYHPEIRRRLQKSHPRKGTIFRPGLLGNYFAKSLLPGGKKMKTFAAMNPLGAALSRDTLTQFMEAQDDLLRLLKKARHYPLQRIKTAISISKFLKLRLGDTLRVVVYHNCRHLQQAEALMPAR